jgi:hypothetical protein
MKSHGVRIPGVSSGRFPRPNMTMRELIGLVAAFALSNAFLDWLNPWASRNVVLFIIWNGALALYLGFAFVQAWVGSIIRWIRTGRSEAPGRPRTWTALGVAEATVIGGTMLGTSMLMLERARSPVGHEDLFVPMAILLIGTGAGFMVAHRWRRIPEPIPAVRRPDSSIKPSA